MLNVVNSATVNSKITPPNPSGRALPFIWQPIVQSHLQPAEELHGWLEINLDEQLNFTKQLLAVTNQRLICFEQANTHATTTCIVSAYPYRNGLNLRQRDHAGVYRLALFEHDSCIENWCYTLTSDVSSARFIKQFMQQCESFVSDTPVAVEATEPCPKCRYSMTAELDECPQCASEIDTPPSTWTLFRLWRFAKPYQWQLLAGFLLMLASTSATLVPPYLTIPLMDKVLIPYQNGTPIDQDLVGLLLAGLFGSALLAWGLGWSKTYILALVSERIGADLRTITYDHLLKLSLEYFGGKRTGDLMARIGSESDRICVFLSLHLLDFATDVLMIVMTAAILVSINPEIGRAHV